MVAKSILNHQLRELAHMGVFSLRSSVFLPSPRPQWKWKCWSLSHVWLFATPWTIACQSQYEAKTLLDMKSENSKYKSLICRATKQDFQNPWKFFFCENIFIKSDGMQNIREELQEPAVPAKAGQRLSDSNLLSF